MVRNILSLVKKGTLRLQGISSPYSEEEDRYNFIYVHIPKTAGNGLLGSLFGCKGTGHNVLDEYINYDVRKFKKYYKFTVVRNPYTRFISAFYYLKNGGQSKTDKKVMKPILINYKDVNDFVDSLRVDPLLRIKVFNYLHFVPQRVFIDSGRFRRNHSLDYIGRQEDLDVVFRDLCVHFNIKNKSLKKINVTSQYDDQLSEVNKSFLYDVYKGDFLLFGYKG